MRKKKPIFCSFDVCTQYSLLRNKNGLKTPTKNHCVKTHCEMSGSVVCSHACHVVSVNAFHVTGECRRQVNKLTNLVKNVKILEFHDHIWNNREKYIAISINMTVIGSQIREIAVKM